jgi:(S)-3,5-dihydroxyphenylglycine transaminase
MLSFSHFSADHNQEKKLLATSSMSHPRLRVMDFLNCVSSRYPQAISFGSGRPADEYCTPQKFPQWVNLFEAQLPAGAKHEVILGQYCPTKGIIGSHIAKFLSLDEQISVEAEDIIVTQGAQEAMLLPLFALFDRTKDELIVTDPCFIGITGAAEMLGIGIEPVPYNIQAGYNITAFVQALDRVRARGKNPKAIYVIPDFDNPLGACMPLAIREQLLSLAAKENVLIFEDNPYGIFRYEGEKIPMLKTLDRSKSVMYMGTFSKTLFPGLRAGFLVADQIVEMHDGQKRKASDVLAQVKSFTTVNTSPLVQAAIAGALIENDYSLRAANAGKIAEYKARRDCMLSCLAEQFSDSDWCKKVHWNQPLGGFFLTVSLPFDFSEVMLEKCISEYGVAIIPVKSFAISYGFEKCIRLAFSNQSCDRIQEGIKRFGKFVKETYQLVCEKEQTFPQGNNF